MTARILAIANQKGGVGKTTTAINLAAELAATGAATLLIDADSQASCSIGLGLNPYELRLSLYQVLLNPRRPDVLEAAIQTVRPCLDVLPATPDLSAVENELAKVVGREHLLRRALTPILARYVYVIVDTPPAFGLLTQNALALGGAVLAPVQPEIFPLHALRELQDNLQLMRDAGVETTLGGVLCTMVDNRTKLARAVQAAIAESGLPVYRTTIPRNIEVAEAPGHGQPLREYAPESAGARAYHQLAEEIMCHD
jgi:chromosome partitioning protein